MHSRGLQFLFLSSKKRASRKETQNLIPVKQKLIKTHLKYGFFRITRPLQKTDNDDCEKLIDFFG